MWFREPHPFLEKDYLPDWARLDKQSEKGDRVEEVIGYYTRTWIDCLSEL